MTTYHHSSNLLFIVISTLACALGFSATLFIIGWAFDSEGFYNLAKLAAVVGGAVGFVHGLEEN